MRKYLVTDPCYILSEDVYDEVIVEGVCNENLKTLNSKFFYWNETDYGDGTYNVTGNNINGTYFVDSGCFCIVDVEYIMNNLNLFETLFKDNPDFSFDNKDSSNEWCTVFESDKSISDLSEEEGCVRMGNVIIDISNDTDTEDCSGDCCGWCEKDEDEECEEYDEEDYNQPYGQGEKN